MVDGPLRINFQHRDAPVPDGFLPDFGEVFGLRDNSFAYGWRSDHTDMARQRGFDENGLLFDTMNHFWRGANWEIQLANKIYNVAVAIGDAWESTHSLAVEGVTYWENIPLAGHDFRIATQTITVTDGRLTVTPMDAVRWGTRICYVIIEPVD